MSYLKKGGKYILDIEEFDENVKNRTFFKKLNLFVERFEKYYSKEMV